MTGYEPLEIEHEPYRDDGMWLCPWCGKKSGHPPPTGPIVRAYTGIEYEDFWVHELDPDSLDGDIGPIYHARCWRRRREHIVGQQHKTLDHFGVTDPPEVCDGN